MLKIFYFRYWQKLFKLFGFISFSALLITPFYPFLIGFALKCRIKMPESGVRMSN